MNLIGNYITATLNALRASLNRVLSSLFHSSSVSNWFIVGFSAWLTGVYKLASQILILIFSVLSIGDLPPVSIFIVGADSDPMRIADEILAWLMNNLTTLTALLLIFLVLITVLYAVSSVFDFIFLDNVCQNRRYIWRNWRQFRSMGISLCILRITVYFIVIMIPAAALMIVGGMLSLVHPVGAVRPGYTIVVVVTAFVGLSGYFMMTSIIQTVIDDFVLPFMYKYELSSWKAWSYTCKLMRLHWLGIVIYWLFKGLIEITIKLIFGCLIVGTLFLILAPYMIPVINIFWGYLMTVAILPVIVFFRLLGPSFLSQLNPNYSMIVDAPDSRAIESAERL